MVREKVAIIPLRGFRGKSRLAIENNGVFSEEERKELIKSMLLDIYSTLINSKIFDKVLIAAPKNSRLIEFCKLDNLNFLELKKEGINNQLGEIQSHFKENSKLLIIASDLPLITQTYLERLDSEMNKLLEKSKEAVVINMSRDLGSATIYLSNSRLFPIELDLADHNLLVQLSKLDLINYKLLLEGEGIIDMDNVDDIKTIYYILKLRNIKSYTYNFLKKNKWNFLLPKETEQEKIIEEFKKTLNKNSFEEYFKTREIFNNSCIILTEIKDKYMNIYLSSPNLILELKDEIKNKISNEAISFLVFKKKEKFNNKEFEIRIGAYGVPCNKLGKVVFSK